MQTKSKIIVVWLSLCFAIIGCHIFLDGISRLKESGYSISNWKKVEHFISASNEDEFDKIFQEYKSLPQFAKAFPDMELPEFKSIYV
ncbi:MAG: COX15/CtaA family protein, partial [Pseudomonadota bacterium]